MQSKRIAALVLALVMACTTAIPAFAAPASPRILSEQAWTILENCGNFLDTNGPARLRIKAAKNPVYGSPVELSITAEPEDTQFIGVVIGTKGMAEGYVGLILPEKVRILLELIPLPSSMAVNPNARGEFNLYQYIKQLIDGNDAEVLIRVAEELTGIIEILQYYAPSLTDVVEGMKTALNLIRFYLPATMATRIYLDEQPTDSGSYLVGAVTLGSSLFNNAGLASIKVARKSEGVRMYWTQQTPATMTVAEAAAFDFSAVTEDNGTIVENSIVSYTYKNKPGTPRYNSDVPPTEPGEYTQTAVLGGNYQADNISREFRIVE